MNITFTQDCQNHMTGNEFYNRGARATLPHGAALVAAGVAREGWGTVPAPLPAPEIVTGVTVDIPVADDLTRIKGIGKNTAADLASFGIDTFAKLAEADAAVIAAQLNGSSLRQVYDWQKQAGELT
jgi:predicted flap endonuclease-1-like 5' DNA nuclease